MSVDKILQLSGFGKLTTSGFGLLSTSRTQRRALLLALVVVSAIGLYRWILAPYGSQLLAAEKYDFSLDGVLRKTDILNTTLEKKKAKLEKLIAESKKLRSELFTASEAREFFASLPVIAGRTGCAIQSVSSPAEQRGGAASSPTDGSGITGKKAMVDVTSGYGNIVAFIKELQTYHRKVWIDSVRIEAGGSAGRLKCQLTMTLYYVDRMEMVSYE